MKKIILLFFLMTFIIFTPKNVFSDSWQPIGPWQGNIWSLIQNPQNSHSIFAFSGNGNIFRSYDHARSWTCITDQMPQAPLKALAFDPGDTTRLYTGYTGFFYSENAGQTWIESGAGLPDSGFFINSIFVHPQDGSLIFVGSSAGIFRSTNFGQSWEKPDQASMSNFTIFEFAADPDSLNWLFAATNNGVYKSVDLGLHWSETGLADKTVYALTIFGGNPGVLYAGTSSGVYKSVDQAASWTILDPASGVHVFCTLAPHPDSSDVLYAGSIGKIFIFRQNELQSFTISDELENNPVNTILLNQNQIIAGLGQYAGFEFFNAYGGVYSSENGGLNWENSSSGLMDILLEDIAVSPHSSGLFVGSLGSLFKFDSELQEWSVLDPGWQQQEIYRIAVDPDDEQILYLHEFYNGLHRSSDGGASWDFIDIQPGQWGVYDFCIANYPHQKYLYRCFWDGLYRSIDRGDHWEKIFSYPCRDIICDPQRDSVFYVTADSSLFYTFGQPLKTSDYGNTWRAIDAIPRAIDPSNSDVLYGIQHLWRQEVSKKIVVKSLDTGETWFPIHGALPDSFPVDIVLNPGSPHTLYVVTGQHGIYKSIDEGQNWQFFNNGLDDNNIRALKIDPKNSKMLYAGARGGVYFIEDSAETSVKNNKNQNTIADFLLYQNFPNPFNPETQIRFQLPEAARVKLEIYNLLGQKIRTLIDAQTPAGFHSHRWDGRDESGQNVAGGIYLYQIKTGHFSSVKKMILLR